MFYMSAFDRKKYMDSQIEEINRFKWIESEKHGFDLGTSAVHEWICRYAKSFRENWNDNINN